MRARTQAELEATAACCLVMARTPTLRQVEAEAADCRLCPLYRNATWTVFGEGPIGAPLLLVGEQPGDQEDLQGKPFVGPAGKMLDRALAEAGIDRSKVYVTNAVKHFKFEPRGKKRIHKKPNTAEIEACKGWLDLELALVKPQLTIALGATAARALIGRPATIARWRGRVVDLRPALRGLVTVHPSFLLRVRDANVRAREYDRFVKDLRLALAAVKTAKRAA